VRITVVVPFRNEHCHIERCVTALTRQEPFPGEYEVVAVADGSTDGSASIVRGFRSVRLIRSSDAGPYAARNAGVAETDGDVVAFTDADCEPAPDWLQALAAVFERREVAAVVGPRTPARESFAVGLLAAYEEAKEDYIFGGHRADLYFGATSNLALRRSALSDVGGFPERRRGADTLVVRRLVAGSGRTRSRTRPRHASGTSRSKPSTTTTGRRSSTRVASSAWTEDRGEESWARPSDSKSGARFEAVAGTPWRARPRCWHS
jgi:glycosyltransferase involved in cell wall biosynthesis